MLDWILSWETVIVAGVVEKDMACETKFEKEWDFHINLKEQEVNKIRIAQNYKKIVETYCLGWITNWFRSLQCSWKSIRVNLIEGWKVFCILVMMLILIC
jgi:hypothetical protein